MSKSIEIKASATGPSLDLVEVDADCAKFVSSKALSDTPPVPAQSLPRLWGRSSRLFTKYFRMILPFFPILAGLAGVACALALLFHFDSDISHFTEGSPWFALTVGFWCSGLVLLLFAVFPFGRRVRQYRVAKADTGVTFCGFFVAALLCLSGLRQLYAAFTTAPDPDALVDILPLTKLAAVFLLCGAFYFLYVGLGKRDTLAMSLSLVACLAVVMVLFRDYFDFTLPLNSPLRYLATLAWSGMLLFLLTEARMQIDLWYTGVPFTVFACLFAVLFTGGYGLTGVIVALAGTGQTVGGQFDLIRSAMFLGVGALAFFRVRQLPELIGDHLPPPPTKDEIKKYAKKHKIPYNNREEKTADETSVVETTVENTMDENTTETK